MDKESSFFFFFIYKVSLISISGALYLKGRTPMDTFAPRGMGRIVGTRAITSLLKNQKKFLHYVFAAAVLASVFGPSWYLGLYIILFLSILLYICVINLNHTKLDQVSIEWRVKVRKRSRGTNILLIQNLETLLNILLIG